MIFADGIDWTAFFQTFQQLRTQYSNDNLSIQAIERKSGDNFLIRLEIPPEVNKANIESHAKVLYQKQIQLLETTYKDELGARELEIETYRQQNVHLLNIVKQLAERPINVIVETSVSPQTTAINFEGDIHDPVNVESVSQNQNLANLYDSQKRYDEAEPFYQQALTLRKRLLGEERQALSAKALLKILVIDEHESVLGVTIDVLRKQYPDAEFVTALTARNQLTSLQPDLVVMDLSIPESPGVMARPNTGLQLLRNLMKDYPNLNLLVQSAHVRTLVRIKPEIDAHKGGFTVADKNLTSREMLIRVDWALQGLTHTKDIKRIYSGLEVRPEWLQVLTLAFGEGLQDKAIAERMCVSERMVRHYWRKLQDALEVYPEEGKNIRIQTEIRARVEGLID